MPIFELDRWNFQQMLHLGFPKTSQSLSTFKQLLFSSFQRGDQEKKSKTCESPQKIWSSFLNRDPILKAHVSRDTWNQNWFRSFSLQTSSWWEIYDFCITSKTFFHAIVNCYSNTKKSKFVDIFWNQIKVYFQSIMVKQLILDWQMLKKLSLKSGN